MYFVVILDFAEDGEIARNRPGIYTTSPWHPLAPIAITTPFQPPVTVLSELLFSEIENWEIVDAKSESPRGTPLPLTYFGWRFCRVAKPADLNLLHLKQHEFSLVEFPLKPLTLTHPTSIRPPSPADSGEKLRFLDMSH